MTAYTLTEEEVVYLDNHLMVVQKPAGLLVQPDKEGNPSLEEAAKAWLKQRFQKPGNVFATACHRLDRPVSGLVVLARTSKALARMNALFQSRDIKKIYLALVGGRPESQQCLRHWIKKNESANLVRTYTYQRGDARQADLCYWQLQNQNGISLLLVRLFTGRHHQIRAQLGFAGLPILGDSKYGTKAVNGEGLCLCSFGMEFVHPVSGEMLRITGRIPASFPWPGFTSPSGEDLDSAFTYSAPA